MKSPNIIYKAFCKDFKELLIQTLLLIGLYVLEEAVKDFIFSIEVSICVSALITRARRAKTL